MYILAYFATPIHLNGLTLEFRQLQFDGAAGVGRRYFELQLELIPHQIVRIRAHPIPMNTILAGLHLEPVVVMQFVRFYIDDDGF